MAQPLRVKVDNADFIYNTEAWFTASTTIWTPSQVLVPIDGADAGKHKFGNNSDVYADLSFIEDGGGPGGSVTSDDVSNESSVGGVTVTNALDQLDSDKQAARDELDFLNIATGNVTAAATTDLGAEEGDLITLVGTTEVTSFGTADAGITRKVVCASATPITYNATTLIIPGSASIVTAAEDWFIAQSYGSGVWHIVAYTRRDGSPLVSEVDNNLTASTTRAPSKTAVNAGLADKATVRVNGALKKGFFTYSGTTNGSGQLTVDLTAQTPAITEATWLGIGSRLDTDLAHAALADGSLAGYAVQFYDNTGGPLGDSVSVTFTIAGQTD